MNVRRKPHHKYRNVFKMYSLFLTASMLVPKSGAAAAPFVLNQTQFLWVIGGHSSEASMSESTEIYSFQTDEWMKGVDLPEPLIGHTVTSLEDSKVLIAGGIVTKKVCFYFTRIIANFFRDESTICWTKILDFRFCQPNI